MTFLNLIYIYIYMIGTSFGCYGQWDEYEISKQRTHKANLKKKKNSNGKIEPNFKTKSKESLKL